MSKNKKKTTNTEKLRKFAMTNEQASLVKGGGNNPLYTGQSSSGENSLFKPNN